MNNGWSEHHHELQMNEIDKLQRKLDDLKRELGMKETHERAAKTFSRVVGRLPVTVGAGVSPAGDDAADTAATTPEQIGGS